jgi:RNA polymerase sigma-70 factor, ECF subfamily
MGDRCALASVLRHHRRAIERMCTRLSAHPLDTEDVIQETYLAIVHNIGRFRGEATFLTWAYTLVRTASGRARRADQMHWRRVEALRWAGDLPGHAANTRPADELLAADELGRRIAEALGSLSSTDREVLLMRDVEGWSAKEVAERIGLTVPAVKTRLHRARTALRLRLSHVPRAA